MSSVRCDVSCRSCAWTMTDSSDISIIIILRIIIRIFVIIFIWLIWFLFCFEHHQVISTLHTPELPVSARHRLVFSTRIGCPRHDKTQCRFNFLTMLIDLPSQAPKIVARQVLTLTLDVMQCDKAPSRVYPSILNLTWMCWTGCCRVRCERSPTRRSGSWDIRHTSGRAATH